MAFKLNPTVKKVLLIGVPAVVLLVVYMKSRSSSSATTGSTTTTTPSDLVTASGSDVSGQLAQINAELSALVSATGQTTSPTSSSGTTTPTPLSSPTPVLPGPSPSTTVPQIVVPIQPGGPVVGLTPVVTPPSHLTPAAALSSAGTAAGSVARALASLPQISTPVPVNTKTAASVTSVPAAVAKATSGGVSTGTKGLAITANAGGTPAVPNTKTAASSGTKTAKVSTATGASLKGNPSLYG